MILLLIALVAALIRPGNDDRPASRACQPGCGAIIMTAPKQSQGTGYRITACRSTHTRSSSDSECPACQGIEREQRSEAVTAGHRMIDDDQRPASGSCALMPQFELFGVGRRARVALTAARQRAIRKAQRAHRRGGRPGRLPTAPPDQGWSDLSGRVGGAVGPGRGEPPTHPALARR